MLKNKVAGLAHIPKWLTKPPSIERCRDIEDATATHYAEHKINPRATKTNNVKFAQLIPHLRHLQKRWIDFTPEIAGALNHPCVKGLQDCFRRIKMSPTKL